MCQTDRILMQKEREQPYCEPVDGGGGRIQLAGGVEPERRRVSRLGGSGHGGEYDEGR